MPLNWNASTCKPPTDDNETAIRQTIIHLTMLVGMGEITEANAPKFYARTHTLELLRGCFMYKSGKTKPIERPITPADIKRWIGLKTNVSTSTDTQFSKMLKNIMRDFEKEYTPNTHL